MALRQITPALQFSEGRSKPWAGAKLINCFSEKADGDKRVEFAVMAIPGLTEFANVGSGPIRGFRPFNDLIYVVSGDTLYSVTQDGVQSNLGFINGTGPVRMTDNGTQLAIAAAPNGYVVDEGVLKVPPDLPFVSDVTYIDSYLVWSIYDSDQCIYSAIGDGMSYDLLDVFTAEGSPDGLVGLIADHRELQLYGQKTIEIFYNSGGSDNAFERQGNAFIERGCFDRDSIVKIDNSVMFMGDDRIVYRLDGYTPVRISTHAIEYQIRGATMARGLTYTQEGHKFYSLTVDDGTFVYDVATGAWHERKSWNRETWRVGWSDVAFGYTMMSDNQTGQLFRPSLDVYDEDGEIISVTIGLPTIDVGRDRITLYAFEAYFESGVGLSTGQGSDPQVMLRYSDDGGRTFSNELWRSLGKIGEYRARAVWRSLGQFRQRDIELKIADPVKRFAISYFADVR